MKIENEAPVHDTRLMNTLAGERSQEALPHLRILELYAAAANLGLHSCRDVLLAGIDASITAALPSTSDAAAQLLSDLNALNRTQTLDGSLPLITWLLNAIMLRSSHAATEVLRRALRFLSPMHLEESRTSVVTRAASTTTGSMIDAQDSMLLELATLRSQLASQTDSIRLILAALTSNPSFGITSTPDPVGARDSLAFLEGIWKSRVGTTYCIQMVNGELRCPYSYGGFSDITGEGYNWRKVRDSIFARFQWLNADPHGYVYLRIVSENKLTGGWWYTQDVPDELVDQLPDLCGMTALELVRQESLPMPEWAAQFFRQVTDSESEPPRPHQGGSRERQ